ncbi:MAG: carbohydrate binding family 9 domain-containing protein, partial [Anaerolineales bacterium]|nr:carbohydrate binding family 9 domain-containing protein [Anaerolineales bacterium]
MKTGLILVLTVILAAVGFMAPLMASRIDWEEVQRSREMNAVYFDGEIILDGVLDEAAWDLAEPVSDFIQKLPDTGALATEKTEVRILYNDETLYIGAHCWDSAGRDGIVVNDITKDFKTEDSDGFKVILDTYNDDRNGFMFGINPAGGRFDLQSAKDGDMPNKNWNGIWHNKTTIDDQGWHLEIAIPFKSLRFTKAEIQEWGVNFERRVRRKSEDSYWSPVPPPYYGHRVSAAGTLRGLKGIQQTTNMYLKPFISAPVLRRENDDWDFQPELGVEVFKWAVTSQLVFDATLNTDFSQVESDDVKTNLTRFSLYFPEKRDFFLENAGVFSWGPKVDKHRTPELLPFFSRRIGLTDDGELVPTLGGA